MKLFGLAALLMLVTAAGLYHNATRAQAVALDTEAWRDSPQVPGRDGLATRHSEIRPVLDALDTIEALATKSALDEASDREQSGEARTTRRLQRQSTYHGDVGRIVEELDTAKQVALLGLACRSLLGEQLAEDEDYDLALDAAYWVCVVRLHQGSLPDSARRLDWLARQSNLHGGDITLFYEITGRDLLDKGAGN